MWMDKLSDTIGSIVPGCSRWPARHPVKVSLVMFLLGSVAGWSASLVVAIDELLMGSVWGDELLWFAVPGAFLGWMVFLPLSQWLQRGVVRALVVVVLSIVANVIQVLLLNRPTILSWLFPIWSGALAGVAYSAAGIVAVSGRRWWMAIPVVGLCILAHEALDVIDSPPSGIWLIPDEVVAYSLIANFFSMIFAGAGVAFGVALWDTTPRPKFEPESTDGT